MSDYITELEKQNEELQHKLSLSQRHADYWHSHVERTFHCSTESFYQEGDKPKIALHEYFITQTCEAVKDWVKDRSLARIVIERYNGNDDIWCVEIYPGCPSITVGAGRFSVVHQFKTHEEFVETVTKYIDSKPYLLGTDE
jgi:hypothetical protein